MRASDQINSTIQKIFDKQIGTASHDDIVLWLYGKIKNGEPNKVCDEFKLHDRSESVHEDLYYGGGKTLTRIRDKNIISLDPVLEQPVGKMSKISGFADLMIDIRFSYLEDTQKIGVEAIETKGPISSRRVCYVEVKTSINIGETIRQINLYRHYTGDSEWFVCAPMFPHVQILKDQGIGFIEYKPTASN